MNAPRNKEFMMGTAYTPGLKVTARTRISKTRRLPLKGRVMVKIGERVEPDAVVAGTELPGIMQTVRVAEVLGIEPAEVAERLKIAVGDSVERGTIIAETKSLFGLLKNECKSPIAGTVELISPISGHVGIRFKPTPVEVKAYIQGKVTEIIPDEGVVIETSGALIQGIFGIGGERLGEIMMAAKSPDDVLDADHITGGMTGKIIVAGANITGAGIRKAAQIGVKGIITGGIIDRDLVDFLGYDIGVAITGQEKIDISIIVTEGFGIIRMAGRTFKLLKSLEGRIASINGATQIRAGVIRPEIIVPAAGDEALSIVEKEQTLDIGARIRIIREPNFGTLGVVTDLPSQPAMIESGAKVRILEAKLDNGDLVTVPRANVEIIQE
ncbi:MAG: hypothetical protein ACYC0V_10280 [Armatimonadota bacterium]